MYVCSLAIAVLTLIEISSRAHAKHANSLINSLVSPTAPIPNIFNWLYWLK